jgi:outer membrane protein TolC
MIFLPAAVGRVWRRLRTRAALVLLAPAAAALPLVPASLAAQAAPAATGGGARPARPLTLEEALGLALRSSESVRIAEAGLLRARGQFSQARAQGLPQLNATAAYQKQLQNQFQALQNAQPAAPPVTPQTPVALCAPQIPVNATPEERAAALARAQSCAQGGDDGLGSITRVFANPNNIILGLTGSQVLFAGGRVVSGIRASEAARRSAEIGVTSARAQVQLDVAQAYLDAALADRLVQIAESSLVQTERAYRQTALGREVGTISEFDLLRARVARDNQRPQLVQSRATRTSAYLRLRQLLVLPLDEPLVLTTTLPVAAGATDEALARASAPSRGAATRCACRPSPWTRPRCSATTHASSARWTAWSPPTTRARAGAPPRASRARTSSPSGTCCASPAPSASPRCS